MTEAEENREIWAYLGLHPVEFARKIFPSYCRLPFAEHHKLLFRWHDAMGEELPARRGLRFVLAAPRGAAKSTLASLVLPVHDIAFERERYVLLISATERQAMLRLRAIRSVLQNRQLRTWLPQGEWKLSQRTLLAGGTRMDAFGAGVEMRGISSNAFRPTKIILDDAETSHTAESARARERLADWFQEVVEHLGDSYTHIIAIGTVLHGKGLIARLLERPDFTGRIFRSIEDFSPNDALWNEWRRRLMDLSDLDRRENARRFFEHNRAAMEQGTRVLWPEKEDYEQLVTQLTLQGRRAFYQEKQNHPLGPEDALFDAEIALRGIWEGDDLIFQTHGPRPQLVRRYRDARRSGRRFAYLDAALAKNSRSDFSALATVLLMEDGSLFLESLWARRLPPSEQVLRLFEAHDRAPFEVLAVEGTGFQELLTLPIEAERRRRRDTGRRADLPVQIVKPTRSKRARITSLEPILTNGTLALSPDADEEFWEELSCFPRSQNDDALDALAGAVDLARTRALPEKEEWQRTKTRLTRRTPL